MMAAASAFAAAPTFGAGSIAGLAVVATEGAATGAVATWTP